MLPDLAQRENCSVVRAELRQWNGKLIDPQISQMDADYELRLM